MSPGISRQNPWYIYVYAKWKPDTLGPGWRCLENIMQKMMANTRKSNPSQSMDFWLQTSDHQVPPDTFHAWGPKQLHWLSRNVRRPTPVAPGKKHRGDHQWGCVHLCMMISVACYSISNEIGHMRGMTGMKTCALDCLPRAMFCTFFSSNIWLPKTIGFPMLSPSWHVASDLDDLGSPLMRSLVNWQPVLRLRDMSVWMKETLQVLWAKLKTTLQETLALPERHHQNHSL